MNERLEAWVREAVMSTTDGSFFFRFIIYIDTYAQKTVKISGCLTHEYVCMYA